MKTSFPQWKGFELTPHGCLLEQVIDLDSEMGFAYERCCGFYKDFHTHDRLMLIFPRGSAAMEVRTTYPRGVHQVDASSVLLVPPRLNHDDQGTTVIYDTMALFPSPRLVVAVGQKLGLSPQQLDRLNSECIKIRRPYRLEEYVREYFFERVVSRRPGDDEDVSYLARRVLDLSLRQIFMSPDVRPPWSEPERAEVSIVTRALMYIESNLFDELRLEDIARASGASVSTLLRRFNEELNRTPYAYIKDRRLEEAHGLLAKKDRAVGEVAILVGYGNFGAFSDAFKAKFGVRPSALQRA
ncbi:MAG: helix-turn-helix transcriptional regulator [Bdellovibrionales bacterium]